MKDVARESGLSLATVSKVINDLPVGKNSRAKVEAAIEKLGYHVNAYARALKSSKTYSVALIMPSLKHPFFAHLTDELTKSLMRRDYHAMLMITNYDHTAEQKCFELVQSNKMDGIIALTYSPDIEALASVPIVTIDRHIGTEVPCVSSDNYRGGEIAAQKLVEFGCKKLAFMRISNPIPGEPDKRCSGFENFCNIHRIDYDSLLIHDEESEEPFYRYMDEHIKDGEPEFDGIFCNSDSLASRVISYLRSRDIRVPEQVQIIGYDGIANHYSSEYFCSTIKQPLTRMAETAVDLLLSPNVSPLGANICLPVEFISGGTTKG